ncbi:MAG: primosomal protein N' [Candidatus Parcubacteria bacterium]|nr:primosomal protein N' [Candidatus Parcubacteria bacterium]
MNKTAQIVPALRLKRNLHYFDYSVPTELQQQVKIGQIVEIPFRNKNIKGLILNLADKNLTSDYELKPINKIIEAISPFATWQIKLLQYLAEYNFVSLGAALYIFLPDIPLKKSSRIKDSKINFLEYPKLKIDLNSLLAGAKAALIKYYNQETKISTYVQLIDAYIKQDKQVLIICPKLIQVKQIFQYLGKYQDSTSLFLNDLAKNSFWQEWQAIKNNEKKIIIGTRSAIFAPVDNLGLIIIDEEDDENHKQEEPNPRYNAKNIALKLQELTGAKLFFCSQTPSLNSLYKVTQKEWDYFEIDKTAKSQTIKIIDLQDEFKKGNYNILSEFLQGKISLALQEKKQIFLFLNRKGLANVIKCKDCGAVAQCPVCKLPLAVHEDKKLHCHHCKKLFDNILTCTKCRGSELKYSGYGLDKIAAEIKSQFPLAKQIKIDKDSEIKAGLDNYDIIIGTQYCLDLLNWQKIGLIGAINSDVQLLSPDYKANEKSFNLLSKLIINNPGKDIVIQTFSPARLDIVKNLDTKKFFQEEIRDRKLLQYPPFSQLIKLIYQSVEFNFGQNEVENLHRKLKKALNNQDCIINSPALIYTQQLRGRYRWQIIIKVINSKADLEFLKSLPDEVIIDIDPESLL